MILRAGDEDLRMLQPDSESAVRIASLWEAYGAERSFCRFWRWGRTGLLSQIEESAVLYAQEESDWEELAIFLSMSSNINRVRSDASSVRQLAARLEIPVKTGKVLSLCSVPPMKRMTCDNPPLRELYLLLARCFGEEMPTFDAWYVDISHRLRHGQCHIAAICEEGIPTAVAMTVAECRGAAVLGAVATRPESRGRGYASTCVVSLARTLTDEQRRIYLCPRDEKAWRLYIRLGFEETGEWGELSFR